MSVSVRKRRGVEGRGREIVEKGEEGKKEIQNNRKLTLYPPERTGNQSY